VNVAQDFLFFLDPDVVEPAAAECLDDFISVGIPTNAAPPTEMDLF
jgi:hypothetical protein